MTHKLPSIEERVATLPQQILSALEYRGFYDCGKYLDNDVLKPVKQTLTSDRTAIKEALLAEIEGKYFYNLPPCSCGLDELSTIYSCHNSGCEWSKKDFIVKIIKREQKNIKRYLTTLIHELLDEEDV